MNTAKIINTFDWTQFSQEQFDNMIAKIPTRSIDLCGSVYIGDICIEILSETGTIINETPECEDYLIYNLFILNEDTGYGYKTINGIECPYDFADGGDFNIPKSTTYEEFKAMTEKLFADYIQSCNLTKYSLIEHANRPTKIW